MQSEASMNAQPTVRQVIRWPQVKAMVGLSEVQVWRLEKAGKFPRRFKLAEGGNGVGWFCDEIERYQTARGASRDQAA
jgi:prophage regulatory protein